MTIDFNNYKNKDPYPIRPNPKTEEIRSILVTKFFPSTYPDRNEKLDKYIKDTFKIGSEPYNDWISYYSNTIKYKEDWKNWNKKLRELEEKFKQDVLKEFGLENHPKKDKLYEIAWEHGHSAGLYEVYYWVQELSQLLVE